ncbi:GM19502 [Drosophila sechellia]|uniref:GM19502 n=1 Tax=Drosophila sechellia TaxID=7238 RepID=B4I5V5_DROSE|nr:GM19502 [Drosophila sechellia]
MEWDLAKMGNGWVRQTEITADKLKSGKRIISPSATVLGTDFQHTLKYITALSLWRHRLACAVCVRKCACLLAFAGNHSYLLFFIKVSRSFTLYCKQI